MTPHKDLEKFLSKNNILKAEFCEMLNPQPSLTTLLYWLNGLRVPLRNGWAEQIEKITGIKKDAWMYLSVHNKKKRIEKRFKRVREMKEKNYEDCSD